MVLFELFTDFLQKKQTNHGSHLSGPRNKFPWGVLSFTQCLSEQFGPPAQNVSGVSEGTVFVH